MIICIIKTYEQEKFKNDQNQHIFTVKIMQKKFTLFSCFLQTLSFYQKKTLLLTNFILLYIHAVKYAIELRDL